MNIDKSKFWERVNALLSQKNASLRGMCKQIGLPYSTLTNQISNIIIPPKLEQIVDMAEYLGITLDELIYGDTKTIYYSPEAQAVEKSPRLQRIINVLQRAPEKLDALETFLDIKHIPAGGGSTHKLLKAQM